MIPYPTTDISMSQSFTLAKIGMELPQQSRQDLENAVMSLLRENMVLKNNVTNLVKYCSTKDDI